MHRSELWSGERTFDARSLPRPIAASLLPASGSPPVEWVVTDGLVAYEEAVAAMEARVEAIADGKAPERVWLVEHPPLYTAGTSARPGDLVDARIPRSRDGPGRPVHLSRAGPARGLCHARPVASQARSARLRRRAGKLDHRHARGLQRRRRTPRGPRRRLGAAARQGPRDRRRDGGGQDRRRSASACGDG